MTMQSISQQFTKGGSGLTDGTLEAAVRELQGLKVSIVAGAAAGTKMDIAALRTEDTIVAAIVSSAGVFTEDAANITIENTKAFGTITISGDPVNAETFVVNGVTYAFKTAPLAVTDVRITTGNNTAMAAAAAAAINAYEARRAGNGSTVNTPAVVATAALGVVTVTAVVDGAAGNAITLTEAATNVAVTGSGTLTSGTDTGGFKSTTNLATKSVALVWFNKR